MKVISVNIFGSLIRVRKGITEARDIDSAKALKIIVMNTKNSWYFLFFVRLSHKPINIFFVFIYFFSSFFFKIVNRFVNIINQIQLD